MSKKKKLYRKALNAPENMFFDELCALVELAGFLFRNQSGSHRIYKHPVCKEMINLQPEGNKAKPYQVKQVLKIIAGYRLIGKTEDV